MTCKYRKVNDTFIYVSQLKATFGLPFLLPGYDRRWRWRFWDRSWKCNSLAQNTLKKSSWITQTAYLWLVVLCLLKCFF